MHPIVPEVSPKCRHAVNNKGFIRLWQEEVVATFRSLWKHRLLALLLMASLLPFPMVIWVASALIPYSRTGAMAMLVLLSVLYAIVWGAGINAWQRLKNPRW
ncbi:hypothetical protein [Acidithiobacillus ferrivorans]|uniref:hypothetical protein n=1 Tax=Acidithiobacillus ferrivorans TaxID=160808 RepID=UPI0012E06014|nr:hypothetical protein [Acidithiobacillus ferrivorans]